MHLNDSLFHKLRYLYKTFLASIDGENIENMLHDFLSSYLYMLWRNKLLIMKLPKNPTSLFASKFDGISPPKAIRNYRFVTLLPFWNLQENYQWRKQTNKNKELLLVKNSEKCKYLYGTILICKSKTRPYIIKRK